MPRSKRNYTAPEDLPQGTEPVMPFEDTGPIPTQPQETEKEEELRYLPEPLLPPITSTKDQEIWIVSRWRPMMAWTYMATCIFDFILGPVFYNILQYQRAGGDIEMWQAITLQGGGLYHVAMGAVLGITALGRTKEKLAEQGSSSGSIV